MSRPIDEKIVAMRMDNSDFARKAAETTGIFGKLRDSLNKIPGVNLGKTTQELGSMRNEVSSFNMDKLSESVQIISSRFSTMGIVAITALTNITNRAFDAGINLAKSLSVDQIMGGFQEYELKMGSIQTILANTQKHGTTLDDVSKSLNELNEYADKTIYSFGDMTRNIGLFTNAGLKLEESTSMIKGFSNAAAASGVDATRAAGAAYQLSQGLSQGYIMLMDWRSLTNAGMGNDNMKRDLIAIANAMGTLTKSADDTMANFNASLSEDKWMTSDVMSMYLQAMAGDLDKATLKTLGLTEAQADMLLQNAKTGEESATFVRTYSQLMDGLKEAVGSGWAMTFENILGDFNEATTLWSKVSEALGGMIDRSSDARNDMIKGIADKGGFQNIFDGIQNASKPVIEVFKALSEGFKKAFPPATVDQIVKLTEGFKAFTAGLTLSGNTLGKITTISQGVFSVFSTVYEIAKRLGKALLQLLPEGLGGNILDFLVNLANMAIEFNTSVKEGNALTHTIEKLGDGLSRLGNWVKDGITNVAEFSRNIKENLGKAITWLGEKLAPVGRFLKETFSGFGGDDLLGAGTLVAGFLVVQKVMGLFDTFGNTLSGIGDSFKGIFDGLGGALKSFQEQVKYKNLLTIAIALGILAVSLKILEGIDMVDILKGLTALATSMGIMAGGMMLLEKINVTGGIRASITLIALATAVTIMAGALKKISDLSPQEMVTGVAGLTAITGALALAVIAISKWGGKIGASSLQLIALATAVYILAGAVKKISEIDSGNLWESIGALAVIFAQLAIFLKVVDGTKFGVGSALGVVAIAGAIHIIISAIKKIDSIDTNALIKGLVVITVILAQFALFSNLVAGPNLLVASVAILLITAAITALLIPIKTFSKMSWTELAKGLGAMAVALLAIAAAGLLANGAIVGAFAMVVMAAALNMLIIPIKILSKMTWGEIAKGVLGLAAGLAIIALTAMLLTPAIIPMLGFGAALLVMGLAMFAAGAGVALFGMGLAALAALTLTSVASIVAALGLLIKGLIELIPLTVEFIVKLVVALLDGVATIIPAIVDTIVSIILQIMETFAQYQPRFIDAGMKIMTDFMNGIAKNLPQLKDSAMNLILTYIQTMTDAIRSDGPMLVDAVLELIGEILLLVIYAGVRVVDALFGWMPGVRDATAKIGANAEKYIRENFGAYEAATDKGVAFAEALSATEGLAMDAGNLIGVAAMDGAYMTDMGPVGTDFSEGFANGISAPGMISKVTSAAVKLAKAAGQTLRDWLDIRSPSQYTHKLGEETGSGFEGGIISKIKDVAKASTTLGAGTGQGFAKGITSKEKDVGKAAKSAADVAKENFNKAMGDADYKLKLEQIDSEQHIAEIEKIKRAYAKYPDLAKEAELKIRQLREDSLKKQFEAEKKYLADRKYYNELSLADELSSWETMRSKYKEGTDQRESADREVYRLKNEINKKLIAENDEYVNKMEEANQRLIDGTRAFNAEYDNELVNRKRSLMDYAGIFDEVNINVEKSGWQLLDNLRGQVDTFVMWGDNLNELSNRGLESGLLEELRQMGPRAAGELAALNSLTDEQLEEYATLWETKNKMAHDTAVEQLTELKEETIANIEDLREQTAAQLDSYEKEWINKIMEIKVGVTDQYVGLNTDMKDIGKNTIRGLMTGLSNMEPALMAQAKSIADRIRATISSALQVQSPSRVTTIIGEHVGEGLVVGMANKEKSVGNSARNLALTAKDALNSFLDAFELPEGDNEIYVKVVVDYDGVDLNEFDKLKTVKIQPDTSYTNSNITATREAVREQHVRPESNSTTDNSRNFNPVTNIYAGPTGKEIARENGKMIQRLTYELGV